MYHNTTFKKVFLIVLNKFLMWNVDELSRKCESTLTPLCRNIPPRHFCCDFCTNQDIAISKKKLWPPPQVLGFQNVTGCKNRWKIAKILKGFILCKLKKNTRYKWPGFYFKHFEPLLSQIRRIQHVITHYFIVFCGYGHTKLCTVKYQEVIFRIWSKSEESHFFGFAIAVPAVPDFAKLWDVSHENTPSGKWNEKER